MTSRKRKSSSTFSSDASRSGRSRSPLSRLAKTPSRKKRQHLLETLESRQLLAGPQLIGIQPNDGELIVNGTVRDTAPRVLTLRFDADQQIDPSTLDGVRITRSGQDDTFGTPDDVQIVPGLVTLGDPDQNEVVVRFADRLPDDDYRVEVFGFDDAGLGITGLRNQDGELLQPSVAGQRAEVVDFRLSLGALIESVVPQPVVRLSDGSLVQNRNEVVVYFNEDPLFVEDDGATGSFGNGTEEITVTADIARSFDDVRINFEFNSNPGTATAVLDDVERTITVTYHAGNDFDSVAAVIDAIDGFNASLTGGVGATDFTAPPLGTITEIKGNPTQRSAENPRFYQLLLTAETVRTTDDLIYNPSEVIYDPTTFTARLFFEADINELPGVPVGGGTFRLRIGTAVDDRIDLILPPTDVPVSPTAVDDFGIDGLRVLITSKAVGENAAGRNVLFVDSESGGLTVAFGANNSIVYDFGGTSPTFAALISVTENTAGVQDAITLQTVLDDVPGAGDSLLVPDRAIDRPALVLTAVGDTLGTALDVGIFGTDNQLSSLVFTESIDPQPFLIEPLGGSDDPGHVQTPEAAGALLQHISDDFGADTQDGVSEIAYNFNGIFDSDNAGNSFLNQITDRQKTRIREALGLWAQNIGVQFRETESEGITFALGNTADLQVRDGLVPISQNVLNASLRIDPDFEDSALVFSNQTTFGTAYGEDFLRKATAGIGLLLGLETAPNLPAQTLMALDPTFLNADIDQLTDLEPVFPGNYDVLHGNYVHRADSIDVDLYRFQVDLDDADKQGTLTAETFAERLPDSSLLDTTLTLFEEVRATVTTDFGVGTSLEVMITSLAEGRLGNNARLDFIQTERGPGDDAVRIIRPLDSVGQPIDNGIIVDVPRLGPNIASVPAGDVVDAINNDPFASSIFRATITTGAPGIDIGDGGLSFSPLLLSGGGIEQLSRNDDYFSEDSRIIASLGAGTYYIGVAASGNNNYDPTIPASGNGGRTQGIYDLHLKFEPQVDEIDVIRDLDSDRIDVPGTPLDGDGDGTPGGANNFWFQTRPLNRIMEFTDSGDAITPGQTITIVGGSGVTRTYQFVESAQDARPGNIPVVYTAVGFPSPSSILAGLLAAEVNQRQATTGVSILPILGTASFQFVGERTISLSPDFRGAEVFGRTIFVDKTAGPLADGSLDRPFNNISNPVVANAFDSALEDDIVRIVGNGGGDNDITTEADNFSYQIGLSETGGQVLEDGRMMEIPKGVTTMIDAGAAFKLRAARIVAGSSSVQVDRSGSVLQVLGTPRLLQLSTGDEQVTTEILGDENVFSPGYDDGRVIFTSLRDREVDAAASGNSPQASAGDWGGLIFRRDVDQAQGRRDLEDEGVFLQRVNHAELRYGGSSNILIDSIQQLVNPIQIVNLRPTVTFNEITQSADSAISAAPNSFEETSFQEPRFQQGGSFTADYDRVGPELHNNLVLDNSINGLFIRVATSPTSPPRPFTVSARFDDTELVHYVAENLEVAGNPGGSIEDGFAPSVGFVSGRQLRGGTLVGGLYRYKMTFVDDDGFESLASADDFAIAVVDNTSVELTALPVVQQNTDYVSRRLYRAIDTGGALVYQLIADLDASSINFIDSGSATEGVLDLTRQGVRGRLDASLVADPGLVMKFRGSRLELGQGTQLLAEGLMSDPVVFTSSLDDRFGAGGTFDTNNDADLFNGNNPPNLGDWSGIYAGPTSNVSFDNAVISYAGGISNIEGGLSRGFLPLELHQADARITNSRFEFNDQGQAGAGPEGRFGRLAVTPATIFARGTKPIIVGNTFTNNLGTIIDIDSDSLNADYFLDIGRQTGGNERFSELDDNRGPLVRFNRYEDNEITGLEIRGGELTTESVWDDTDIAHLLFDSIIVNDLHSSSGLRLISRPDESLVVKFSGSGTANSPTQGTGLTARGFESDIEDRVGGTIHLLGLPGAPVVLTSFRDDSVGAGLKPDGSQFTDNNGDGLGSRAEPNDWRSVFFDQYSNDYNADFILERELSTEVAPGLNGTTLNAQDLGILAERVTASDEQLRLGFEVEGFLAGSTDVDTYAFTGFAGTEVWLDVDRTLYTNDTVIEVLDAQGNVVARSDDSFAEVADPDSLVLLDPDFQRTATPLQTRPDAVTPFGAGGLYEDFGSYNERDAGLHFTLPGNSGAQSPFFFRVRSRSVNPDDASGGLTGGGYRFQIRLTEEQIFPGSVARYTDIRYANHGIHVRGLPGSSPLLGEAQENESVVDEFGFDDGSFFAQNDVIDTTPVPRSGDSFPLARPQYIGNLVENKANVISVGGSLAFGGDVDFYRFEVDFAANGDVDSFSPNFFGFNPAGGGLTQSVVFDVDYAAGLSRPDTNLAVFYDEDGVFGGAEPRLVFFGENSNVADDQTTPFGEDDESERLERGSVSTGDALIGPVNVPEGTYYIAVVDAGVTPAELENSFVRREPINSIERLFEDRVNADTPSTADGPRFPQLFTNQSITDGGYTVRSNGAATLPGHGKPAHFDGTNPPPVGNTGEFPEFAVPTVNFFAGNLDALTWSLTDNPQIGGESSFFGGSENTSTLIPHVSISGDVVRDPGDVYLINIPVDPNDPFGSKRVIIDVDEGFNPLQGIDDTDPLTPPFVFDPDSVDLDIFLVDLNTPGGATFIPNPNNPGTNRIATSLAEDGRDGSLGGDGLVVGSPVSLDPFADINLQPGAYLIYVVRPEAGVAITNGIPGPPTMDDPPPFGEYILHVSVEDHVVPASAGNATIHFDRNSGGNGTLVSESFDLLGYAAADAPRFYFNYLLEDGVGDTVTYSVSSNESPTQTFGGFFGGLNDDGSWRQQIVDLDGFAGDTNIQITFNYNASGIGTAGDGLYLDDFVIGFAERGETVFQARQGEQDFTGFGTGTGEYQLELRRGTEFTDGTQLTRDFDTNDRHSDEITLIAPNGSQVSDGDTFTLSDGTTRQVFEFTIDGFASFSSAPVRFSPTDSAIEIAEAIRRAINLSPTLRAEAASASGDATGPLQDNRINLFGIVNGDFQSVDSHLDPQLNGGPLGTTADGHLEIPAIIGSGKGDLNFERTQSQVIIDSNIISDVNAIGIWSEPGTRDVDLLDLRNDNEANPTFTGFFAFNSDVTIVPHPYLDLAPVGNTYPGAVRNLPTRNDSVLGGLSPGVVIVNNTIDQAQFAGVKIEGETRPIVLHGLEDNLLCYFNAADDCDVGSTFRDGALMAIDAAGTRVVFEFEDISGNDGEGEIIGGDGYADGHVPIYYREGDDQAYNGRTEFGYSAFEMMYSIYESIQGSILVTNDLVELVTPTLSIDPFARNEDNENFARVHAFFANPAVWLEGASGVYFSGGTSFLQADPAPIHEAPQPFARLINNTIYGADGTQATDREAADRENDDLSDNAIETRLGRSHLDNYVQTAAIGDNGGPVTAENDVDFYKVELNVGDRLVADVDTAPGTLDTIIQIYNEFGELQTVLDPLDPLGVDTISFVDNAQAPSHLDPESTSNAPVNDAVNPLDPFMDFIAPREGTYYVAVSSRGNEGFDPNSLSGRDGGEGGTGDYQIGLRVFAGRSHVISLNGNGNRDQGTDASEILPGSTITLTQITDYDPADVTSFGFVGNQVTFEFTGSPALVVLPNGNINVPIQSGLDQDRVPDIMRALARAINGNTNQGDIFVPNEDTAVNPGRAIALGGIAGDNSGIRNLTRENGFGPLHTYGAPTSDFFRGFGHDRLDNPGAPNTLTGGLGTTELYVLINNIADVQFNDLARQSGFVLGPDETDGQSSQESDQLLTEHGVLVAGGASPTLVNNVIVNTHQSIVREETSISGFGARLAAPFPDHNQRLLSDRYLKPMEVIVSATVFQHDEPRNTAMRANINAVPFSPGGDAGIITDGVVGVSNVNGGDDDFNVTLQGDDPLIVNGQGNDFQPSPGAYIIDSATNSLTERDAFAALKNTVGIPVSNILAPSRDVSGILRADNRLYATPGGLGSQVFKDRGSSELADFVGPVAIAEIPRDNDAEGFDSDPAVGFINLTGGVYDEFRIQLRDNGDSSDPFSGIGIDDTTVVIPEIPGLRPTGATITLFENDRLLTEGIDYVFNFDETKNIITLTPLAGIWQDDRAYRIAVNNRDRNVLVAPDPSEVNDGDQVAITDTQGGTVVFEFESGYQLLVPEPITLIAPRVGTNAGGLSDGDIFQIDDGENPVVVFEFNSDTATLPGTVPVTLPTRATPTEEQALDAFLNEIANNVADAIQTKINEGLLNVDVRVLGDRVVVGAEPSTTAITTGSGLQQLPRTLALRVPDDGFSAFGINDGDTFIVSNGNTTSTFEFDGGNGLNTPTNIAVPVVNGDSSDVVAAAIQLAIENSSLGLSPQIDGNNVYVNLPVNGSAVVPGGQLRLVGLSRTAVDGDTIVITPNSGLGQDIVLEINRTDEPDPIDGTPMNDGVTDPNVPININRLTTADELAALIANELQGTNIPGLDPNDVQVISGGLLSVGGEEGLGFAVASTSLEVTGSPSVTGASTIQVFGPLLLQLPLVGGGNIFDGSVLILKDDADVDTVFEFNLTGTAPTVPGAIVIQYNTFDTVDILGDNLVQAINLAQIGITAQNLGTGRISLGRIPETRVNTGGIVDPADPANSIPGVPQITTRRGIVSDGEVLTIRQGAETVSFEFESINNGGGVQPGNIGVAFQPGSTIGDVAISLAAAINNNRGNLRISAEAELAPALNDDGTPVLDPDGNPVLEPTGQVLLDDLPGTVVDVTAAPTLNVTGVPGGAIPIRISPAFSAVEVKRAILNAFNTVNAPGEIPVTTLSAEDRGGATFFVENGEIFEGPLANYFLQGVKDLSGNLLEPNRDDLTTQFTILMPTVSLDFGDAPDPVLQVPGRYPTLFNDDGPRHVVDGSLTLGRYIDADVDGQPVRTADGDDLTIEIFGSNALFSTNVIEGAAEIEVNSPADIQDRDGDTVTIDTGIDQATIEFDLNGRFDEDNFAVRPIDESSSYDIADAVIGAINESPIRAAGLISGFRLIGSDSVAVSIDGAETLLSVDGFSSTKVLQLARGVDSASVEGSTFTITVAGQQARFEFDTDGTVADGNVAVTPVDSTSRDSIGDAIRSALAGSPIGAGLSLSVASVFIVADDEDGVSFISDINPSGVLNKGVITPISVTVTGAGVLEAWIDFNADGDWTDPGEQIISSLSEGAIFSDAGVGITRVFNVTVPATAPDPIAPIETYARFRVSVDGGLEPNGLALSGEVEDYVLLVLPGGPPQIANANRTFVVEEDRPLQALDGDGLLTPSNDNDNGLLTGVVDLQGDDFVIFADDVGTRTLMTPGGTVAGVLNLLADGTFSFQPSDDFNGVTGFTARVSDVKPFDRDSELVNSVPISVTINVVPVNDPPVATQPDVIVNRTIDEDVVQTFSIDNGFVNENGSLVFRPGLIADNYVPGPQNESSQPMVILSAGSIRGVFISSLGGTIEIADDGTNVIYTPPADYNGAIADTFTYTVADVPGDGQLVETAAKEGTVSISFNAVNDPPRLINDNYGTEEDTLLQIPVIGNSTVPGILDNDTPGPIDEIQAGQTIALAAGQFPKTTFRGGTVSLSGNILTYDPPSLFSGIDQFEYTVVDIPGGASATATVSINIGGVNNGPVFVGINGNINETEIIRDESKQDPQQATFDLTTWFEDPESDALTFSVVSSNSSIVAARVIGDLLILDFPPFAFTQPNQPVNLAVTAADTEGAQTVTQIPVTVNNTPDPPSVIGSLNPLNGNEDQLITADLSSVFADPDQEQLIYSVARIGNIINPTDEQISLNPLVKSITFVGDEMRIELEPNQSGDVEIEIAATDTSFRVSNTFTLTILPVADRPVASPDGYNVPVGAKLQVLNPSSGLLRNDSDADGDAIAVDLITIDGPTQGTLDVLSDGTFTYTNTSGTVGGQDSFTYRVVDATGRFSDTVTVNLNLNQSRYQNPLEDLSEDVNADGEVTAIDVLRIINFLSRAFVTSSSNFVPVSEIGAPPPDYYDTNGNGRVSASDAVLVINRLSEDRTGSAESTASFGVTSSFAAASTASLPVRQVEMVDDSNDSSESTIDADPRDALLAEGLQITTSASDQAIEMLPVSDQNDSASASDVDDALTLILDEISLDDSIG